MQSFYDRASTARHVLNGVLCLLALTASAQSRPSGMTFTFGAGDVTVSGVPRAGGVVVFGIGIGTFNHAALLTRHAEAAGDEDRDGSVTVHPRLASERSVWVAVDVQSGHHAVATPGGAVPLPLAVAGGAWRSGREQLEISTAYLEALVVRPRVGAWTLRMGDGGSNDADARPDGVLTLRLERMQRLFGDTDAPPVVAPGDLLVMVDPQTLQTYVGEAR